MDSSKNKIYFIIILTLIVVILLQKCGGNINPVTSNNDTIRTVDTTYSIVTKEVKTYIPKWHTKVEYVHDTTKIIDTAYVIGDYYSIYTYQDSLITDTLKLYINDSITQNKIKSRDLKYKMVFPTVHITDVVIKNKNEFYVGLGLVGSKTSINYFGPELLLRTKSKKVYGLGLGVDGNLRPNLSLRTYWKIGKK